MSRVFEKGNVDLNDLVFDTVSIGEDERGLEIGSGPGALIERMAATIDRGCIEGIDFSEPMVALARKKNRKSIEQGKVKIHLGDFDRMALVPDSFDKVFTVNTIYFWQDPDATLSGITRVLKPGGKLVIGFNEKKDMEKMSLSRDIFRLYGRDDIRALFSRQAGLGNIEMVAKKEHHIAGCCAVCTKTA